MPENELATNTNGTTGSQSSSAPTSGNPEAWRAGNHSRFAGKSPEEILGIAEGLAIVAERFNQPIPAPVIQPQTQPSRFDLDIADDDYVDGRKLKQIVQQVASQNQQAPYDPIAAARNAKTSWELCQMKRPDDFKRYKQEIWNEAQRLPVGNWDVDNLEIIVDIVRSRHIDELAAEKAQRLVNESHPTIRSGSGGGSGSGPLSQQNHSLDAEGVPESWKVAARAAGITMAEVREFAEQVGTSVDKYMEDLVKYGKGAVIRG